MLNISEDIKEVKGDDLQELFGVRTSRLVLHWRDRLLLFRFPEGEKLGLDLRAEVKGYNVFECPNCEEYITLDANVGKDHPYRAMKSAMSAASRALAKLESVDRKAFEKTGRHIPFHHLVLTFPSKLRGIDEKTAWKVFKVFWKGLGKDEFTVGEAARLLGMPKEELKEKVDKGEVKVEERQGPKRKVRRIPKKEVIRLLRWGGEFVERSPGERGWGASVNLHSWSSKNPEKFLDGERHLHFHVILGMATVDGDSVVPEPNGWLDLEGIRQAWARAIEEVTGYKFDKDQGLRYQLDVHLAGYFTLGNGNGRAKLLHDLKYSARRWIVDLAMKTIERACEDLTDEEDGSSRGSAAEEDAEEGAEFLSWKLTLEHNTPPTPGNVERFLDLWRAPNRAHTFGWWCRLKTLAGEVELRSRCPICGGPVEYLGRVELEEVWDFEEVILVGKRGEVRKLPRAPGWFLDLVLGVNNVGVGSYPTCQGSPVPD